MDSHVSPDNPSVRIGNISGNWNRITIDLHSRFATKLPSQPLIQYNDPSVPLYFGEDGTFERLCAMGSVLKTIGVTHAMVACNTFHMRRIEFMYKTGLFVFDMCGAVKQTAASYKKVAIISTAETAAGGLYESDDYELLIPLPAEQETITRLIHENEKSLGEPHAPEFVSIVQSLALRGAECLIIGCTDLTLMLPPAAREIIPVLDPMDELIELAVAEVNKKMSS